MALPDEQEEQPIEPEFSSTVSAGVTYSNSFTTSWETLSLEKKTIGTVTDVVVSTVISVVGNTTTGYSGVYKSNVNFDVSGGISTNFISYNNLKNDDIITWSRRILDNDYVFKMVDESITKNVSNLISVGYQNLPWR